MRKIPSQVIAVCALTFALITQASARSEYDYKPGEFLVIKGGKSPDGKVSIVAGENKAGEFGVYLMDAQRKKVLGPLEEVETGLDTGPDAYHAHWSPDSKHVGISSREDRHLARNVMYRIENRHAYPLETPQLMCPAVPEFCRLQQELGGVLTLDREDYYDAPWKVRQNSTSSEVVKWISPTRFVVEEESQFQVRDRDPSASLGDYGEVKKLEHGTDEPGDVYHVWFNAEGECELLPGDKTRVVSTRPVKDQKTSE